MQERSASNDPTGHFRSRFLYGRASIAGVLVVVIAVALFMYAAVRARTVSFTYDEAYTYMEHVLKNVFYQSTPDKMGGNHHLLNVWCMWLCHAIFGDSEFALRLPNLIAYVGYLYASGQIVLRARNALLAVGCFALLNFHPYLIDFFSLARGYGLANAFMMLSLWQTWQYLRDGEQTRRLMYAAALAGLSAVAHVIMVNYLIAFVVTMGLWLFVHMRRSGFTIVRIRLMGVLGITFLALCIVLPNAFAMFRGGSLNFGCDDWWNCAMRTLAEREVYHVRYGILPLVVAARTLWMVLGVCTLVIALVWRAGLWQRLAPFLFGLVTLAICLLSFILQHEWFGVPLPEARTALFLIPLMAFVLVAALLAWPGSARLAGLIAVVGSCPLAMLMHDAWNTDYSVEWKSTGEIRAVLEIVERDHLPLNANRPRVNLTAGFGTSSVVGYYILSRDWQWLGNEVRTDTGFAPADYYVVEFDALHLVDEENWTRLFHSPATDLSLYRDERARRDFTNTVSEQSTFVGDHAKGYSHVMDWVVRNDLPPGPMLAIGTIRSREQNNSNWLGMFLEHRRNGRILAQRSQPSHLQVTHYGKWEQYSVLLHTLDAALPGDTLRFVVQPCFTAPAIEMGRADLRILR